MAAFRSAVEDWAADMLEMDVRLTADGRVVVIHDETVDRTTDGTGVVADLTLEQLRRLDAGHHFVDLDGAHSFRGKGVGIPTFEEVLDACPGVWINVEAKERRVAGPLVEIVRRRKEEHRVLLAAEFEECRRDVRGYSGPWGASRSHVAPFWLLHHLPGGGPYTPHIDILQLPEWWHGVQIVTPRLVREAHRRNIPVQVWTVDDEKTMRRMLDWGVDGIQTDRPDVLADLLTELYGRHPAPARRREASE